MIRLKSNKELELMRQAGRITAAARAAAARAVRPGVTTGEIDKIVRKTIEKAGFLDMAGRMADGLLL